MFLPRTSTKLASTYLWVPESLASKFGAVSTGVLTANRAYYLYFTVEAQCEVVFAAWYGVTATGNYDIGLYDSGASGDPGTRLASKGSTAVAAGANTWTVSGAAGVLSPGVGYYVGFTVSSGALSVLSSTNASTSHAEIGSCVIEASALPLPSSASATTPGGTSLRVPLVLLTLSQ